MSTLADALAVLDVEPVGPGRYRGGSLSEGAGQVVFGGQLLAQTLIAASKAEPDKQVLSMHTMFIRGASVAEPLELVVEPVHTGRAFAMTSVTMSQGERMCTRSLVLMHRPDPDLISHQEAAPTVEGPDGLPGVSLTQWWDARIAEGADIRDPDAIGPARLRVWSRFPDAPTELAMNQALLAYATDGFLIGTAMRPHRGVGQALAHISISTTVLAHTLTFHRPFSAADWLLLDQRSTSAGSGRSHGLGEVFGPDGQLVCSFSQENMIRDMPEAHRPAHGSKSRY